MTGTGKTLRLFPLSLLLIFMAISSCTTEPPIGEPLDFDQLRRFAPFTLRTTDGDSRSLDDYLGKITLISFFFPT